MDVQKAIPVEGRVQAGARRIVPSFERAIIAQVGAQICAAFRSRSALPSRIAMFFASQSRALRAIDRMLLCWDRSGMTVTGNSKTAPPSKAAIILLPKKLRAEWVDAMALDVAVTAVEFRVACVIGSYFSSQRGDAFPSQQTLARVTGLSKRTIWGATKALETKGYLLIKRRELGVRIRRRKDGGTEEVRMAGGRGVSHLYFPAFERSQLSATFAGQKLASRCDQIWEERSQRVAIFPKHKVAPACEHSEIEWSQDAATKVAPTYDLTLKPSTKVNPDEAASSSQLDAFWRILRKDLGDDVFNAWLKPCSLLDGPPVIRIQAPSRFIRSYVNQHYLDRIIRCCRAVDPSTQTVEIIIPDSWCAT